MTKEADRIEAEINRSRHALNNTIEQLGDKLSPGQILDEAVGLAQGQAGEFTANLGRQARDNPLPVLLIGAGIAMLFMNKKNGHAKQEASSDWTDEDWRFETRYRGLESARASVVRGMEESEEDYQQRLHEAEARAMEMRPHSGEGAESFKARVKSAGETLGHTASGIRSRMGSAAHAISSGAGTAARAVSSGVGGAGRAVGAGMSGARDFVSDQAHNLSSGMADAGARSRDLYNDYPLAAGAIGIGIGALIGAATPLTAMERDKLRNVADMAAKHGADIAEQGARAVERTADKTTAALH